MGFYKAYAPRDMLKYATCTDSTIFITLTKDKISIYLSIRNLAENIANLVENIANSAENIAEIVVYFANALIT